MIFDKIENIDRYSFLKQIKHFDLKDYQKGKIEINEDQFFGIGLEYETKDASACLWEAHKKYLDIHFILEGEEIINISEVLNMNPTMDFDYENDYQLFKGNKQQSIHLKKGYFLALSPNECHQTAIMINKISSIKKIVFKINLQS